MKPPLALERPAKQDQKDRRAERKQRFFVVEPLEKRRESRGEKDRNRQAMAGPIPAREPPRHQKQHEAEQDRGPVRELHEDQRDHVLQDARALAQRRRRRGSQEHGAAQKGVGRQARTYRDRRPLSRADEPACEHEAGEDEGERVVGHAIEKQRGHDAVVVA